MVSFKTKKIKTNSYKRRVKRKVNKNKKTLSRIILKLLMYLVVFWTVCVIIASIVLYYKIIIPLPPVTKLREMAIPQSSEIYDRDWNLLYSVFKEKRTYVDFDKISKNMVNAIVAWEDKRFWTNPGFDLIWLLRAAWTAALTWHTPGWTSTISQQLIKNTFLTNERSYERKIKEIYLSYKMTNEFDKKTIVEMYLNKISFWNNAFWIEQASKTYFGKSAKDLNVLESSILASIPKWPTLHSPYRFYYNKDKKRYEWYPFLMWYPYIYKKELVDWIHSDIKRNIAIEKSKINIFPNTDISSYTKEIEVFKSVISNIVIKKLWTEWSNILVCGLDKKNFKNISSIDNDWCTNINYSDLLTLLNNIRVPVWDNYIEYETGRKDFILQRMFEDWYLSKDTTEASNIYINAIKNWILFKFKKSKTKIKYPHFVFYVKEFLEEKYGKTAMEEGWLKIYTTLDSKLQDKAQSIVEAQAKINTWKFWANNAAEITIDNKKGEIITMVGWKDYYDKEIDWENNIITSRLQPGSTFKPFVYALAMQKNKIWPKTPVFDVKTVFPWWYTPHNFDSKFMKKMSIEKALNHSRNIPAIKMYYLAWKELSIINFMRQLWVESYYNFKKYYREKYKKEYNYWAPMALWTWEMTPLELATAYSTISSLWDKKEITPILKVLDSNWNNIYLKDRDQKSTKESIDPKTAYLITSILTNTEARPSTWNPFMTIPWRKLAAKTWTSTKQFKVRGVKKIYPQNLWTIGYTPQYTTVAWAGNTNWKQLYGNWNWLEWAWPIMRNVMTEFHKWKKVESWNRPNWIKEVFISTNSWKLPTASTPVKSKVSWLFINAPTQFDDSYFSKEVDALCNWKVTEKTPADAIKLIKWVRYHSLKPEWPNWESPVSALSSFWDITYKDEVCERWSKDANMQVWVSISNNWKLVQWANYVELAYKSVNPIIKLIILLDWKIIASYDLPWKKQGSYKWAFNIPSWLIWNHSLTVKSIDDSYYSKSISRTVSLWWKDKKPPLIILKNPARWSISLKKDTSFNLRASFTDISPIRAINIYFNNKKILSSTKRSIVTSISSNWLELWDYNLRIDATDINFNKSSKNITVSVIE